MERKISAITLAQIGRYVADRWLDDARPDMAPLCVKTLRATRF
jgi:hypothetical protein